MNKAIFLDRDGVINIERGKYTFKIKNFHFVDGIFESCKLLQNAGYFLIIITNQGGIAKKIYTLDSLETLHNYMIEEFKKKQVLITEIYCCPHYPDYGKCICRKPGSLMLEKALARFNIDPEQSYFIGDSTRDVLAGNKVGIKGIKINSNQNILNITKKIIDNSI